MSEVVDLIGAQSTATLVELDLKELEPMPWRRVEELARLIEPVKERIIFGGIADCDLRGLLRMEPTPVVSFNPAAYLDWAQAEPVDERDHLPRGAYGYLDAHPLARKRTARVADYLEDQLSGVLRLAPGGRETHLCLSAFERMLDDGVDTAVQLFHHHGLALDVWTLDAEMPRWRDRLARALAAGTDIVTTNYPTRACHGCLRSANDSLCRIRAIAGGMSRLSMLVQPNLRMRSQPTYGAMSRDPSDSPMSGARYCKGWYRHNSRQRPLGCGALCTAVDGGSARISMRSLHVVQSSGGT